MMFHPKNRDFILTMLHLYTVVMAFVLGVFIVPLSRWVLDNQELLFERIITFLLNIIILFVILGITAQIESWIIKRNSVKEKEDE